MVRRSKGLRYRSRKLMRKRPRDRGKVPLRRILQVLEIGDRVAIDIEPAVQKGQPHKRFQGLTGTVVGRQGSAYVVDVKVGNKVKKVVSLPVHLRKLP